MGDADYSAGRPPMTNRNPIVRALMPALLICLATAAGCGGANAPTATSATSRSRPVTSTPTSTSTSTPTSTPTPTPTTSTSPPPAPLGRHDIPPHGVREQIDYVPGAGPWGCDTVGGVGITFARRSFVARFDSTARAIRHQRAFGPLDAREPQVGEDFVICFGTYRQPVDVTATGPGGVRRHVHLAHGVWARTLSPSEPPGRWVVTATQAGRRLSGSYTVRPAADPGLNVRNMGAAAGSPVDVLLVGFRPGQRVPLDVYGGVLGRERFITRLMPVVSADGGAVYRIRTRRSDVGEYVLVAHAPHERVYSLLEVRG